MAYTSSDVLVQRGCIVETLQAPTTSLRRFVKARSAAPHTLRTLLGPVARLASSVLGTLPYLFNEQYIVKPPADPRSAFSWHRDSDWCTDASQHSPYVSVWVALDDVTSDNGPLLVVPGSHLHCSKATTTINSSTPAFAPREDSLVQGAAAEASGAAHQLLLAAGDAVVMHDRLLHCSLANTSRCPRRAWMPQLSAEPLCRRPGGPLLAHAVPLFLSPDGIDS